MNAERFTELTSRYGDLKIAIVGDFCLDRYFEIDPSLAETSIETGLEVHNVTRVRTQPGAAGTILNNLVALGVGAIYPIGFCGEDGEGWLLEKALADNASVCLDHFLKTPLRKTFTYSKPLVLEAGKAPRELNRLDQKNWSETPAAVSVPIVDAIERLEGVVDAIIVMDQVDVKLTGVITKPVLDTLGRLAQANPRLPMLADSRLGLGHYPALSFKMNAAELERLTSETGQRTEQSVMAEVAALAEKNRRPAFVTLAENGIVGAAPDGQAQRVASFPVNGEIDIVGAGDSVTANLTAALAVGAKLSEAMQLAMAGASIVVHQLGTTGTATQEQLRLKLGV